jgi:hypothetical protein
VKGSRKFVIWAIALVVMAGLTIWFGFGKVDKEYLSLFLSNIVMLTLGFFAGNSLEHIGSIFGGKKDEVKKVLD